MNTFDDEIKRAGTLVKFKKWIAKWDAKLCNCLICK